MTKSFFFLLSVSVCNNRDIIWTNSCISFMPALPSSWVNNSILISHESPVSLCLCVLGVVSTGRMSRHKQVSDSDWTERRAGLEEWTDKQGNNKLALSPHYVTALMEKKAFQSFCFHSSFIHTPRTHSSTQSPCSGSPLKLALSFVLFFISLLSFS